MSKETKSYDLKRRLILAMQESYGIVTSACLKAKCSRKTFYEYMKNDEEFRTEISDIENINLDFVESKLLSLINDENPAAIFFYLKCKGKSRGYVERNETDITTNGKELNQPQIIVSNPDTANELKKLINGND